MGALTGLGVLLAAGLAPAAKTAAPSAEFDTALVWAQLREARPLAGEARTQVRLRLALRPEAWPDCVRGRVDAGRPLQVGEQDWWRIRITGTGACPWARLELHPQNLPSGDANVAEAEASGAVRGEDRLSIDETMLAIWTRGALPPGGPRTPPQVRRLRDSGLGHLLAISGLHAGLVAGLVLLTLRLTALALPWRLLRTDRQGWASLAVVGASTGVLWIGLLQVGAPPSAVRAVGLLLLALLARQGLRRMLAWEQLVLLLLAVIRLADPALLQTLGLQLSLSAIAWLTPLAVLPRRSRIWAAAVLPWLGTAPLLAPLGPTPLVSPLANLLGLPIFGLWVFPAALGTALAEAWMPSWAGLPRDAFRWGLWLLDRWSAMALDWGPSGRELPAWSPGALWIWPLLPVLVLRRIRTSRGRIASVRYRSIRDTWGLPANDAPR